MRYFGPNGICSSFSGERVKVWILDDWSTVMRPLPSGFLSGKRRRIHHIGVVRSTSLCIVPIQVIAAVFGYLRI